MSSHKLLPRLVPRVGLGKVPKIFQDCREMWWKFQQIVQTIKNKGYDIQYQDIQRVTDYFEAIGYIKASHDPRFEAILLRNMESSQLQGGSQEYQSLIKQCNEVRSSVRAKLQDRYVHI